MRVGMVADVRYRMNNEGTRRLLTLTFAGLIALLLASEGVGEVMRDRNHTQIRHELVAALQQVTLAGRIGMDVQREQNLIGRHIFASTPADIAELEREIAATRMDLDQAAHAFAPLATFPGESDAWYQLTRDLALRDASVDPILTLSRNNHDAEARTRLMKVSPLLEQVLRDVSRLVALSNDAARRNYELTDVLVHRTVEFRMALRVLVIVLLGLTAIWLTRAITRGERQLEAKNQELDAFAGRVAHDLKGPLTTINVAASVLEERAPQATTTTKILRRGVDQMSTLVDDLLTLSRAGAMPNAVASTEGVTQALSTELGPMAETAGGKLRVELEAAQVACSERLLCQALFNLGENALKYRREGEPVTIAVAGKRVDRHYVITCADNGQGMAPQDAARVFEPFYRADRTRSIAGTGLGLAIVHRIVDAAGGRISVRSELGRGTTFELCLPLA